MKKVAMLAVLLICAAFLFSCSSRFDNMDDVTNHKLELLYKKSTVIVRAVCKGVDENTGYADMRTEEILVGNGSGDEIKNEVIHCEVGQMCINESYILFLDGSSVKENRYGSDDFTALKVSKNAVYFNKKKFSQNSFEDLLKQYDEVVSTQTHAIFFNKLDELIKNSDDIIIGKISAPTERNERTVYSATDTTTVKKRVHCVEADIRVVSNLRGSLENDDKIHMLYIPDNLHSMTDSLNLNTISMSEVDVVDLNEVDYYVFFLKYGADEKQNNYLPVNAIQGILKLNDDKLTASKKNTLFGECNTLKELAVEIAKNKQ